MKLVLTAVEPALLDAWRRFCGDLQGVEVHAGSIFDVACDAIVSPANSFGFMDGGIDALYQHQFGSQLGVRVRRAIHERHHGELLVGAADVVETGAPSPAFLLVAPTMRVPMILRDTVNAYLATRATLLLVQHGRFPDGQHQGRPLSDLIRTIAFPGMGTGVGRIGFGTCARQVRAAIEDVLLGKAAKPGSWAEASERHQLLYTDRPRRLQYDE